MNREFALEIVKLLSALESWSFAKEPGMLPEYLMDRLVDVLEKLEQEVLK